MDLANGTMAALDGATADDSADRLMIPPPAEPAEPGAAAGTVFQSLAITCFFLYAMAVVLGVWPLQLLQAEWQIRCGQLLISQAPLALLGLGFAHLAAYLDPDEPRLQLRLLALRRWSVAVAFAFLLLVPLQVQAFWGVMRQDRSAVEQQRQQLAAQHRQLRQAIRSAAGPEQLELALERLQGPRLTPAGRQLPLKRLQQQLLQAEEPVSRSLARRLQVQAEQLIGSRLRTGAGLMLSALALAFSFAACGQRRFSEHSLLQEWLRLLSPAGPPQRRPRRARRFVESDYFESLSSQPWRLDPDAERSPLHANQPGCGEEMLQNCRDSAGQIRG